MRQFTKMLFTCLTIVMSVSANPFYGNILFEKGSADLTADTQKKLSSLISPINAELLKKSNESLVITGYIDQSSEEINDSTLSNRRATAVATYIQNEKKIPDDLIVIRGSEYHTYHILTVTAEGRRLNRRAEIVIRRVQKKEIPLILNIVELAHCKQSKDSTSVLGEGDTLTTGDNGFARLTLGTRATIDLDENSQLTIVNKKIIITKGKVQINRVANDETAPIFTALKSDIIFTGNGSLHIENGNTLFVSVFQGTGAVNSPFGKKSASAMEGIAVLNESSKIIHTNLPTSPLPAIPDTIALIPGTSTPISWNRSGEKFNYVISSSRSFSENLAEFTTSDTTFAFGNASGVWYLRFQAETAPGFRSLWSSVDSIVIAKKIPFAFNAPFSDTLFTVSGTRPFSFSGISDTNIQLFCDTTKIIAEKNGAFAFSKMLNDDLNKLPIIALNPDGSKDTTTLEVLYNGADEIIDMNDSIMGKPAFSTSRHYTFRGTIPNATALKINGVTTPLDESKAFEKKFKLPGYEKIPVDLEISFTNGHTKTIKRTVERIEHDTPLQTLFLSLLGIASVAALFVFVGMQSAQ